MDLNKRYNMRTKIQDDQNPNLINEFGGVGTLAEYFQALKNEVSDYDLVKEKDTLTVTFQILGAT